MRFLYGGGYVTRNFRRYPKIFTTSVWHLVSLQIHIDTVVKTVPSNNCMPSFFKSTAETSPLLHHKVPFMEKVLAALLVARSDFIVPIKDIITRLEAQRKPHPLATVVARHKVKALQRMLTIYRPAVFALGHGVRECRWGCKNTGTGYRAR